MFRKTMIALASSAALTVAGPALAQGQSGAHGGGQGAAAAQATQGNAGAAAQGNMDRSAATTDVQAQATTKADTKKSAPKVIQAGPNAGQVINKRHKSKTEDVADAPDTKASKSQGPTHASPTGIAHASDNSVLARGAVQSSTLPGLAANMTVKNGAGAQVGTVTQIITGPNNTIRAVVVTSASGQTYTLPANTLTISGGVVTTTSTSVGG